MYADGTHYVGHDFAQGTPILLYPVEADGRFKRHAHPFYEITYIAGGRGTLQLDQKERPISKGDLIFIPCGMEHVFLPSAGGGSSSLQLMNCLVDRDVLLPPGGEPTHPLQEDFHELTRWFSECTDCIYVREQTREFARIMFSLEHEQKCKPTGFRSKLYLYLLDLLSRISHAHEADSSAAVTPGTDPVQFAIDNITMYYQQPVPLEELCRTFWISPRHFQRKFKEATGSTYTKMLQDIRICRSCELLTDTDWSIQSISREVGLQDMKHFYQLFKQRCGVTPSEFRARPHAHLQ